MLTHFPEIEELLGTPAEKPAPVQTGIPEVMSGPELVIFLGLASARFMDLAKDGVMVRVSRGRFDVRQSLHNYLARLRDGAKLGGKAGPVTDELKVEKLRLARRQAEKLELSLAASRAELVNSADVEREWQNILRDVRSALLAVPSRVGSKLPHLTAHDVAEIGVEIKAALEGLADGN
jgi:phage terminase Nu1 subunit (DNA packaging protein)